MRIARILQGRWLRILLVFGMFAATADAADRLAGDHITLRNGSKLHGVLFERSDKSVTLLVSAKWLSATNTKLHQTARQQTIADNTAGLEQAVRRLKAEPPPAGNAAMAAFLKQQLEDAEAELAKADDFEPDFLWLTLPMKEVTRVEAASPEHRQLLAWAWTEPLDRAETRSVDELSRELKARNVSPIGWPLPFIERLPAREQSEDEWTVRHALARYALEQKLDFQGTGDVLVRTDKDAPADVGQLLVELLRKQLQSQLGDLLTEPRAAKNGRGLDNAARAESLKKAIQTAESEQQIGFRVTRLDFANDVQQATITTEFVARLGEGSWKTIFQHTERADTRQVRPEVEQRIQNDPRVKQVLDLTRQLGVVDDGQIQQAIRFGAATMAAQQACNGQFAAFRDIYLTSLVRPPLSVPR
jgi:hypothetical protein